MTLSTYRTLHQRIDEASRNDNPMQTCAAWATMTGFLVAEVDRLQQDNKTLMDIIRDLRAQVERLESER